MSKTKIDIVTALAEAFGRNLSEPAAKLYIAALGGITDEQAKAACAVAVQRCKFFPSAAELIEFANTGGVSYESQALLAFEQLDKALTENKPSLMPPMVAVIAKQLGGFDELRTMPLSQLSWKRKEFLAAYASLARDNPDRVAALAGPTSEIAQAMLKRIPTDQDRAAIEDANRRTLIGLNQ
jgi:hypothetical protein